MTPGCVYLVGAGPGDPSLLTVRALGLLRAAEVVAHDELVPPAILALARPGAEVLPVGRRRGCGPVAYRLHPDVLARARAGRRVVRLKSGDPFVFGRGGEEAEELVEAGIPFEVVPGVSAALGAAAAAGIPLTHRECASDVTFVSGHDADGSHRSWTNWGHLAAGRSTLVLFMASRQLNANLMRLVAEGRSPDTPAAYVVSATLPGERVIVGTLGDLAERICGVDQRAPALVIVGDVVGRRVAVAAPRRGPLAGLCVLLARARPGPSTLAARLRSLSATVLEAPLIEATAPTRYTQLDAALERIRDFSAVLFDAPEGLDATLRRAKVLGIGANDLASARVVAIGKEVGTALARRGIAPAATIPGSCRETLRGHEAVLRPGPLLLVTHEGGRPSLREDLEALDLCVESVAAYRYVHHFPGTTTGPVDLVVLPSSSAAISLLASKLGSALLDVPMVAMGRRSEEAARRFGARHVGRAPRDDVAALVACVITGSWEAWMDAPRAERRGWLVVYTGHGKGKTTAALGLVFRALGRGLRVAVVQFIKGRWKTGERVFAATIPRLTFLVMGRGFTWESDDLSQDRRAAQDAWSTAKELIASGEHAIVVLDELTYAIHFGFVSLEEVLETLRCRPTSLHVVVTGRNAPEALIAEADLVTEMRSLKHPFEHGATAQPGIDF